MVCRIEPTRHLAGESRFVERLVVKSDRECFDSARYFGHARNDYRRVHAASQHCYQWNVTDEPQTNSFFESTAQIFNTFFFCATNQRPIARDIPVASQGHLAFLILKNMSR